MARSVLKGNVGTERHGALTSLKIETITKTILFYFKGNKF
jgi:hypothetical protein